MTWGEATIIGLMRSGLDKQTAEQILEVANFAMPGNRDKIITPGTEEDRIRDIANQLPPLSLHN
jgi:hypothetical protein